MNIVGSLTNALGYATGGAARVRVEQLQDAIARIKSLEAELAQARFAPAGDNHHNAVACPYCNPEGKTFK